MLSKTLFHVLRLSPLPEGTTADHNHTMHWEILAIHDNHDKARTDAVRRECDTPAGVLLAVTQANVEMGVCTPYLSGKQDTVVIEYTIGFEQTRRLACRLMRDCLDVEEGGARPSDLLDTSAGDELVDISGE